MIKLIVNGVKATGLHQPAEWHGRKSAARGEYLERRIEYELCKRRITLSTQERFSQTFKKSSITSNFTSVKARVKVTLYLW